MNLYTLFYTQDYTLPRLCRVWANDLDSVVKRCNNTLGQVYFVLEGHPKILSHSGEEIPTYDWGNPN